MTGLMGRSRSAGPEVLGPFGLRRFWLVVIGGAALFAAGASAQIPAGYAGQPFNDDAYRAQQLQDASRPKLPFNAFEPVVTVWDSKDTGGTGWVGEDTPQATIGRDDPDSDGHRFIHYHTKLDGYHNAVFGWRWAGQEAPSVDLRDYDAISFSIKVTGPVPPQELFFSITDTQAAPLSLRAYEPYFSDGWWHRITLPIGAMRWNMTSDAPGSVRGIVLQTFVWDGSEYDVQIDHITLDRATGGYRPLRMPDIPAGQPQAIPGRVEATFYDLGGAGVAYHDTTAVNILSGILNQKNGHQRPHATAYEWNFRREEGVDTSFTKDAADLNHPNYFSIAPNQLYLGGAEDGEWVNYTVDVKTPGTYRIIAAFGNDKNGQRFSFSLNGAPASVCTAPMVTGSAHIWARSEVGTIVFPEAGRQLLTLHYGRGFNLAYFDFEPVSP